MESARSAYESMTVRSCLIAGNWKLNGSLAMCEELAGAIAAGAPSGVDLLVCPPFPYIQTVGAALKGSTVFLGAQNAAANLSGAFTGEVAAAMLADVGASHAIVGHSERRSLFGETSEDVAARFKACVEAGVVPILCVGETLEQRDAGSTADVVGKQIEAVLAQSGARAFAGAVIAYEPVWAIGTGKTATPEMANDVHAQIRAQVAASDAESAAGLQILYGGSMKPSNAAGLLAMEHIDGGLIGGAALSADDFLAIAAAAI